MKKILVPTDFSENAFSALAYAYRFSSSREFDIDLVHFSMPQAEASDFPTLSGQASLQKIEFVKDLLAALIESLQSKVRLDPNAYHPKIDIHSILDFPVHGIHHFAKEHSNALIICGSRGENIGITDRLLGTVSGGIIQNTKSPILFVPPEFLYSGIDQVAFATELNHSDPFKLWRALQFFLPDVPVTRCLHITQNLSKGEESKKAEFEKYIFSHNDSMQLFFHDIESKNIDEALQKASDSYNFDMLIMVKKKMNFIERLLKVSHTRTMLKKVHIPLLVMVGD